MTAPACRIPDQSRSSPILFWAFAVLFTVITSPFLLMPFPRLLKLPLAIVDGVLFAAALVVSFRGSRSHPVLVLENVPVSIGGTLRGHIEIPADPQRFANARVITLQLSKASRDHVGGSVAFLVVSQETTELPTAALRIGEGAIIVPVQVNVPADEAEWASFVISRRMQWLLDMRIDLPGIDYIARFQVPVAPTAASPTTLHTPDVKPVIHTIPARETTTGLELYFAPFRSVSAGIGDLAITAALIVATVVAFRFGSSLGALAVLLLFVLPFVYFTLDTCVRSSTIVVSNRAIFIERRLIVTTYRETIASAHVHDVSVGIGGGSSGPNNLRVCYTLRLQKTDGKRITLGNYIENKREADWIAQQICERLGLPPKNSFAEHSDQQKVAS